MSKTQDAEGPHSPPRARSSLSRSSEGHTPTFTYAQPACVTPVENDVMPHLERAMTTPGLVAFVFFAVAGSPSGIEPAVAAGGPMLALLVLLVVPWIWALPVSLITAELSCAWPCNGGYVIFMFRAFGYFWSFQVGWWSVVGAFANQASYVLLGISYIQTLMVDEMDDWAKLMIVCIFIVLVVAINFFGLEAVGVADQILAILVLMPFVVVFFWGIGNAEPKTWGETLPPGQLQSGILLSNVLWNMLGFAAAGTVAGEVKNPQRTYPLAMILSIVLVICNYELPLLVSMGREYVQWDQWSSGTLGEVAGDICGKWMAYWIAVATVASNLSMLVSGVSSTARVTYGMSSIGLAPRSFAFVIKKTGAPYLSVLFISAGTGVVAAFFALRKGSDAFNLLVEAATLLGALPIAAQCIAFLYLRKIEPNTHRPFCIPGGWWVAVPMVVIPIATLLYLIVQASTFALLMCAGAIGLGMFLFTAYFVVERCSALKTVKKMAATGWQEASLLSARLLDADEPDSDSKIRATVALMLEHPIRCDDEIRSSVVSYACGEPEPLTEVMSSLTETRMSLIMLNQDERISVQQL